MRPLAHRASEEFDKVLDGIATVAVEDRYAHLLATVEVLRSQPQVLPRVDFVADLRSRLMTAAETEMLPASDEVHQPVPRRASRNRRRLGTVTASLVIVGGSAGMAAAASGALPGDSLYPVKRGIELVGSAAHLDQAGRGTALLDQAATRLDEVRQLQARSTDLELVDSTLEQFRSTAESGSDKLFLAYRADGDATHIRDVRTFTSRQMGDISALTDEAGPGTSDSLIDAADTVADIDQQARVLCASCAPQPDVALPEALTSAAGALTVDNLLARPVAQAQADIAADSDELDASLKKLQADTERRARQVPTAEQPSQADTERRARQVPTAEQPSQAATERRARQVPTAEQPSQAATERRARQVPTAEQPSQAATDARAARKGTSQTPVSSTITPDGRLLPTLTTGVSTAVKDLVTGVTSTSEPATGTLPKTGTPLDDTLGGPTEKLAEDSEEVSR